MIRLRPLALLFIGLGCDATLEYPYVEEETSSLCDNARDDDLDGRIDCNDPGCATQPGCRTVDDEETLDECLDDADGDGDGLVDGNDPGCFGVRPPAFRRCAPTDDVRYVLDPEAELGDELEVLDGDVAMSADGELGLRFAGGRVASRRAFSALAWGTRLSIHPVVEQGEELVIRLVRAELDPRASSAAVLELVVASDTLAIRFGETRERVRRPASGTLVLDVPEVGGQFSIDSLSEEDAAETLFTVPLDMDEDPAQAEVRLAIGGEGLVDALELRVPASEPCGNLHGPFGAQLPSATYAGIGSAISVAARENESLCALVRACDVATQTPRVLVFSYEPLNGAQFQGELATPHGDTVVSASISTGPRGYRSVWTVAGARGEGRLYFADTDCGTFVNLEFSGVRGLDLRGSERCGAEYVDVPSYIVTYADGTMVEELFFTQPTDDHAPGSLVLHRAARYGGVGPFVDDGRPAAFFDASFHPPMTIVAPGVGGRVAIVRRELGAMQAAGFLVRAPSDDAFRTISDLSLLRPGSLPDSFDSAAVLAASMTVSGNGVYVLYAGRSASGGVDVGAARVVPRAAH